MVNLVAFQIHSSFFNILSFHCDSSSFISLIVLNTHFLVFHLSFLVLINPDSTSTWLISFLLCIGVWGENVCTSSSSMGPVGPGLSMSLHSGSVLRSVRTCGFQRFWIRFYVLGLGFLLCLYRRHKFVVQLPQKTSFFSHREPEWWQVSLPHLQKANLLVSLSGQHCEGPGSRWGLRSGSLPCPCAGLFASTTTTSRFPSGGAPSSFLAPLDSSFLLSSSHMFVLGVTVYLSSACNISRTIIILLLMAKDERPQCMETPFIRFYITS